MTNYLPSEERAPDSQYRDLMERILRTGVKTPTKQGTDCYVLLAQTMRFPLVNGFPIINERGIRGFWRKPIDELGAMINGARTEAEFKSYGVDWWGSWTTESKTAKRGLKLGDIGPGSYGAAFRTYPWLVQRRFLRFLRRTIGFDQFAALVWQIQHYPNDRRHLIEPWIPPYVLRTERNPNSQVTIAPCHGWVQVTILDGQLYLEMKQRSGDVPVGVPSNMVQYAALTLFLAHLTGYEAAEFIHHISNAHVYTDQADAVETMLGREPRPLATITLNAKGLAATDIHEFRGELFDLEDYHPHPGIAGIPVAV